MQRLGFPKCKRVETGHPSTNSLYDTQLYHTDACAHIHTKEKPHIMLLHGTQKYERRSSHAVVSQLEKRFSLSIAGLVGSIENEMDVIDQ